MDTRTKEAFQPEDTKEEREHEDDWGLLQPLDAVNWECEEPFEEMCWKCHICNILLSQLQGKCFVCQCARQEEATEWQLATKWAVKKDYWWTCTICNFLNVDIHATSCRNCGNTRQEHDEHNVTVSINDGIVTLHDSEMAGAWSCIHCTFRNIRSNDSCMMCRQPQHGSRKLKDCCVKKKLFHLMENTPKNLVLLSQGYFRSHGKDVRMQMPFHISALIAAKLGNMLSQRISISADWGDGKQTVLRKSMHYPTHESEMTVKIILKKFQDQISIGFFVKKLPNGMTHADLTFYFEVPELQQRQTIYAARQRLTNCGIFQRLDDHFIPAAWVKNDLSLMTHLEISNVNMMEGSNAVHHVTEPTKTLNEQIFIKEIVKKDDQNGPDHLLKFVGDKIFAALWLVNGRRQHYELRLIKLPHDVEHVTCKIVCIDEQTNQTTLVEKQVKLDWRSPVINLTKAQYTSKDFLKNSEISTLNINILLSIESTTLVDADKKTG